MKTNERITSLDERREIYETYLKNLNEIPLLDSDGRVNETAKEKLFLLASNNLHLINAYDEFGREVYDNSYMIGKVLQWKKTYAQIGSRTAEDKPRLFFGYIQSTLAKTIYYLNTQMEIRKRQDASSNVRGSQIKV